MTIKLRDHEDKDHDAKLVKNGVVLTADGATEGGFVIYSNDWASYYEVRLKGRKPFVKFLGRDRAYR